jgi:hypothetical protein
MKPPTIFEKKPANHFGPAGTKPISHIDFCAPGGNIFGGALASPQMGFARWRHRGLAPIVEGNPHDSSFRSAFGPA